MNALLISCLVLFPLDDPKGRDNPLTPDEHYQALSRKWEFDWQAFCKANDTAKSDQEIAALHKLPGCNPFLYVPDFMSLAREHPGSSAAEASLIWVASHAAFGRETEEAKKILSRDHIRSARLAPVFAFQILSIGSEETEPLLRKALAESPQREIRGMACYWLARYQMDRAEAARQARRNSQHLMTPPSIITDRWGTDYLERLKRLDPEAMDREAESLFDRVVREFADLPHNDKRRIPGPIGTVAAGFLRDLRDLAVGKLAPDIEGDDLDGRRFRLSDYRGRVVVLDFGSHFFCGACREMYPHERGLVKKLEGQPFSLVTIDADNSREEVKAAWKAEGNTWRCVYEATFEGPIKTAWNVNFFPTIVVIDGGGVIRFKALGDPGEKLDQVVADLIAERNPASGTATQKP
jgi:thiol-disulfide isomerase/thioredoxin